MYLQKVLLPFLLAFLVNFDVSFAGQYDHIPEVCGMKDVPKLSKEEKEAEEEQLENPPQTVDDLPEGIVLVGDVMMTKEEAEARKNGQSGRRRKRNVVKKAEKRWSTNKPVYYSFDESVNKKIKMGNTEIAAVLPGNIKTALDTISKYSCIKFEEVDVKEVDKEKFHIKYTKGSSARSYVGKQQDVDPIAKKNNYQLLYLTTMNFQPSIIHETMHALGFNHEQERPDRDTYVKVNYDNIDTEKHKNGKNNFIKYDESEVDTFNEPYDFNSIMHYGENYLAKKVNNIKQKTIEPTKEYKTLPDGTNRRVGSLGALTEGDVKKLNKLFNCDMPVPGKIEKAKEKVEESKEELGNQKEDIKYGECSIFKEKN